MRVAHTCSDLEPALCLVVGFESCRISLKIRIICDTLIVQVAERTIETQFLRTAAEAEIVFLSETLAESFLNPVVREQCVEFAVIVNPVAKCCVRVEFTVRSDKVLVVGNGIDDISKASVSRWLAQSVVGCLVSRVCGHFVIPYIVVVECLIIGFVILARVCDLVIVLCGTHIHAPFCIEGDSRALGLGLLCGDHYDTVGTSCTVQCVGSCILEHCNAFYVIRIQVVPSSVIRCAVNNYER